MMRVKIPLSIVLLAVVTFAVGRAADPVLGFSEAHVFVPRSGDKTGVTDTAAIQAAINKVQALIPLAEGAGVVELGGGSYYLNNTITLGAVKTNAKVALRGIGCPRLEWAKGAPGGQYMLAVYGSPNCAIPILSNLSLWCDYRARGILCSRVNAQSSLENIYIRYSVGAALDLIHCWCLNLRNISVQYFRGYGLRTWAANACHYDSLFFLFGDETGEPWPPVDDAACVTFSGEPFRTTTDQRACVFFHGVGTTWTNLGFESMKYGDYPLLYLPVNSQGNTFASMYLEGIDVVQETIHCDGASCNSFEHVWGVYGRAPQQGQAECFLRCTGTTKANAVHRLMTQAAIKSGGHVVLLEGANHTDATCEGCVTERPEIAKPQWIGSVNPRGPER